MRRKGEREKDEGRGRGEERGAAGGCQEELREKKVGILGFGVFGVERIGDLIKIVDII